MAGRHPKKNLSGQRFGMLAVKSFSRYEGSKALWECFCDCGGKTIVYGYNLKNGNSKSCGCRIAIGASKANTTHGKSGSAEYAIYFGMLSRCFNENNTRYHLYGGRGITVCERWCGVKGFDCFIEDMGPRPSNRHSLDRINNDGPYCADNCRWATHREQMRNTSRIMRIEYEGYSWCLKELCETYGFPYDRTYWRLHQGWRVDDALFTPNLR